MKNLVYILLIINTVNLYSQSNLFDFNLFHRKIVELNYSDKNKIGKSDNIRWDKQTKSLFINITTRQVVFLPIYKDIEGSRFKVSFKLQELDDTPNNSFNKDIYLKIGFVSDLNAPVFYSEKVSLNFEKDREGYFNVEKVINIREGSKVKYFFFQSYCENKKLKGSLIKLNISQLKLIQFEGSISENKIIENGGFENYYNCQSGPFPYISDLIGWQNHIEENLVAFYESNKIRDSAFLIDMNTGNLSRLNLGSPNLVCSCMEKNERFTHLNPRTGNCHVLLALDNVKRLEGTASGEYICSKMFHLEKGKEYLIEFWFRYAHQISNYRVNSLGILLSKSPYSMTEKQYGKSRELTIGTVFPSDSSLLYNEGWQKFSYKFIASENTNYLTIGPFHNPNKEFKKIGITYKDYSIYYVDDVSVNKVE